ncbi:MAG: hypothetical protein AAF503_11185 [Pseudomonadota bacterium]
MQNHRDLLGRTIASAVLICAGVAAVLAMDRTGPAPGFAAQLQGLWGVCRALLVGPVVASLTALVLAGAATLLLIIVLTMIARRDPEGPPARGVRLLGNLASAIPTVVVASVFALLMTMQAGVWAPSPSLSPSPDPAALVPTVTMTVVMLVALTLRAGVAGDPRNPALIADVLARAGRDLGFCLPVLTIAETLCGYPGAGSNLVTALLGSNWPEAAALALVLASSILVIGLAIELFACVLAGSRADG